jgi:CheY-like chemotaxis protein
MPHDFVALPCDQVANLAYLSGGYCARSATAVVHQVRLVEICFLREDRVAYPREIMPVLSDAFLSVPFAVLVVEDDDLVRDSLIELLRELRVPVFEAVDGPSGIAQLQAHPEITIALTDIMMPGMDGLTFAALARTSSPGLKVVFISGARHPPPGETFLAKPFSPAALLAMVQRLLRSSPPMDASQSGARSV